MRRAPLLGGSSLNNPSLKLGFLSGPADSRLTTTRAAGGASYYDSTGTLQMASANTPRIDYGPTPGGVTNWVHNSTFVGASVGTPGSSPTMGLANPNNNGVVQNIVGLGTLTLPTGVTANYIDVRFFGTTAGTFAVSPFDNYWPTNAFGAPGQTWVQSFYCAMIAGSMTNITNVAVDLRTNSGLFDTQFTPTATLTRYSSTGTLSAANSGISVPALAFSFPNGVSIDITLRFSAIQLEQGSTPSAWIPTYGSVVNVGGYALGMLIEESRTNSIRNPRAEGSSAGTPGTLPTNWSQSQNTGIVPAVVGSGYENGIPYLDLRWVGTVTGGNNNNLSFESSLPAASPSQTWTLSAFVRLVGGSWTNVGTPSFLFGDNTINLQTAFVSQPTNAALGTQRFKMTATTGTGAVTAISSAGIQLQPTVGQAIDITLRVGAPMLEIGAAVTSPILPAIGTPAVTTRASDNVSLNGRYAMPGTLLIEASHPGLTHVFGGICGSTGFSNAIYFTDNASIGVTLVGGSAPATNSALATVNAAAYSRMAVSVSSTSAAFSVNGSVPTIGSPSTGAPAYTTLALGSTPWANDNWLNGYIRAVKYWPRALSNAELQAATALDGPSLTLDFITGNPASLLTTTRAAGGATLFDATGTLQMASANTPRIDYGPTPGGVTNWIPNSTMVGASAGSPGTFPTGWTGIGTASGITFQCAGTGTEDGFPYCDIRISGVPTSSFQSSINLCPAASIACVVGQASTVSAYLRTVAGSRTGFATAIFQTAYVTSALTFVGNTTTALTDGGASLASSRQYNAGTVNGAGAVKSTPLLTFNFTNNIPVDWTFRVGGPQYEFGVSTPSSYVPTSGTAANIGATPIGILIEEPRTNSVRNPRLEGAVAGTPGTAPTFSSIDVGASGLSSSVVGSGYENGIPYVDVRWFGTATAADFIRFHPEIGTIAVTTNQSVATSVYLRLIAGSFTNVSNGIFQVHDNTGADFTTVSFGTSVTGSALGSQPKSGTAKNTSASVASLTDTKVQFNNAIGAVDLTLRIGAPTIEIGSIVGMVPTSPILPTIGTPAATTRAGDQVSMPVGNWFVPDHFSFASQFIFRVLGLAGNYPVIAEIDNGSGNNIVQLANYAGLNSLEYVDAYYGNLMTNPNTANNITVNVPNKGALSFVANNNAMTACLNAGTVASATTVGPGPNTFTTLQLGNGRANYMNGWIGWFKYWPRVLNPNEIQAVTT